MIYDNPVLPRPCDNRCLARIKANTSRKWGRNEINSFNYCLFLREIFLHSAEPFHYDFPLSTRVSFSSKNERFWFSIVEEETTIERAVFAFMLQLSFYQNTFHPSLASYRQYVNVFFLRDIEWGFPRHSTKHQREAWVRSSCKINQWDFSSSNELSSRHDE